MERLEIKKGLIMGNSLNYCFQISCKLFSNFLRIVFKFLANCFQLFANCKSTLDYLWVTGKMLPRNKFRIDNETSFPKHTA